MKRIKRKNKTKQQIDTQYNVQQQCDICDMLIIVLLNHIETLRELESNVDNEYIRNNVDDDACFIDARVDDAYYDLNIYRVEFIES